MSAYKDYIEEQLPNRFVFENDFGFITYNIEGDLCNLEEIYILPEHRRLGYASMFYEFMSTKALEYSCKYLVGYITIGTNNSENSMKCLFKNGFKLYDTQGLVIKLMKQIGG